MVQNNFLFFLFFPFDVSYVLRLSPYYNHKKKGTTTFNRIDLNITIKYTIMVLFV
jgi:hypothetical protein